MIRILFLLAALSASVFGQSKIEIGQAIEIRIQGVPSEEMNRVNNTYPVSESGIIRMPFIGDVRAAGLNPNTLGKRIEARYRSAQIYTQPTVQVFASSDETMVEYVVTVGGEVRRAGPVPYKRGLTLYAAVQSAGGATEFGSIRRVKLLREGKIREYNLREIKAKSVELKPNDTIEVPQKNWLGQ
jgi:polysaccharide export outer membrane protein